MKKFLTLVTVLFICVSNIQAFNIKGRILSMYDSTAIAGASCRLFSGERFVTGTATDNNGSFKIASGIKSPVTLKVSMTGYESSEILIDNKSKDIDLGDIFLSEANELSQVTVTANAVINSKGHTIVYPSSEDVKASSTSLRLFEKLPLAGLLTNPVNRTISVDGGSPMILINGVPSTMSDVNALQPKDIEKIEYSRVTPARYADKGCTGFINITLKERKDGGDFYAWARSAVNTTFVDGNVRASYHQGPSRFTLSYVPSWRNYKKVYDRKIESYIGNDFKVNLEETDRNPFNYTYHETKLKYDYSPSVKTLFSAAFSVTPNLSHRSSEAETKDSELGNYTSNTFNKSKDLSPSLDLFLRHDFNDNNTLEAQMVGTMTISDYRRTNEYFFENLTEEIYRTDVDSRRNSLISEITYSHSFNSNSQLSGGFQNTVSRSTNTYLTSDYKPVLRENNNYVYARFGQRIGQFYLSLSTGAKLFWIENDLNKRHFVRNLSTAQLTWNINNKWNMQGAFFFTPSIPSLSSLTDYPQQTTPYLISNGNPDLKVAENFTYNLSASYSLKKFSATFLTAFTKVNNSVISDMTYLGDGLFLSQSVNARNRNIFSNSLSMRVGSFGGFGANMYLNLTRYHTSCGDWSKSLTSFSASMSLWWSHGPWTVSYWRKVPGKYLSGYYVGKEENGDALSIEWQPNKHWTIGADWMYMFDKKGTRYPAWSYSPVNPYVRYRNIANNANMFVLSFSYSADFGSIFRTARRNLNNSDSGSSLLKM